MEEKDVKELPVHETIFVATEFLQQIPLLRRIKQEKGLSVCVALPTLNEEDTIEDIINTVKVLVQENLVDELFVIDGNSTDRTVEICQRNKIPVFTMKDIESDYLVRGKGIQLWKSVSICDSDIICWTDTDIKDYTIRYVLGLIAPLILHDEIKFTKAFYLRPLYKDGIRISDNGGGRVTELCARPLLNLLHPSLKHVIQPLSGEYAMRCHLARDLRFTNNFGVETMLLIDFYQKYGSERMAQVDMGERVHRNKEVGELANTSFRICQVVLHLAGCENLRSTFHAPMQNETKWVAQHFVPRDMEETILPSINEFRLLQMKEISEIYFVRHGQTEWNVEHRIQGHTQTSLNENGRQQAKQLLLRLQKEDILFDEIYSSDLHRCVETCDILTNGLFPSNTKEVKYEYGLRERDFGDWSGKSHNDLRLENKSLFGCSFSWSELAELTIPNAETLEEFLRRILSVMKKINNTPGKKLVVTSQGFLHAFYRHTKKLSLSSNITTLDWPNGNYFKYAMAPGNVDMHLW